MMWMSSFWLFSKIKQHAIFDSTVSPHMSHFLFPLVFSVFVTVLRLFIERYFFKPLGMRQGLKSTKPFFKKNNILEKAFLDRKPNESTNRIWMHNLAKQVGLTETQVERWMRQRKDLNQPTELKYFTECGWRFTYHSTLFLVGLFILWDKPWFWNINECWTNFPNQTLSLDVVLYYIFHLSVYMSHTYSQIVHWRRNDFLEMFIHHVVTIFLMVLSWTSNSVRIGTLVLVVHDCSDIFMEAARITKFINLPRICNLLGALFFISWIITRLGIFPFHILRNIWFDAPIDILNPVFSLLILLLHILLGLHIFWTYFIIKIFYNFVVLREMVDDSRSFSGDLTGEENKDFTMKKLSRKKAN